MSTYNDIETVVLQNLGRDDNATKAMILAAFNTVQTLIATSARWEELQKSITGSFIASTDEYLINTWFGNDFYKLENLKLYKAGAWEKPLVEYLPVKWDEAVAPVHHTTTNTPKIWMTHAGKLYLHPKPDIIYPFEARIYIMPTAAVSGINSTLPFNHFDSVFINAITGLIWSGLEEVELAKFFLNMADNLINGFMKDQRAKLNFSAMVSHKNSAVSTLAQSWLDPFQRSSK